MGSRPLLHIETPGIAGEVERGPAVPRPHGRPRGSTSARAAPRVHVRTGGPSGSRPHGRPRTGGLAPGTAPETAQTAQGTRQSRYARIESTSRPKAPSIPSAMYSPNPRIPAGSIGLGLTGLPNTLACNDEKGTLTHCHSLEVGNDALRDTALPRHLVPSDTSSSKVRPEPRTSSSIPSNPPKSALARVRMDVKPPPRVTKTPVNRSAPSSTAT